MSNLSDYQFYGDDDQLSGSSLLVSDSDSDAAAASFPFVAYHGVTGAPRQQKFDELAAQGYRMISLSVYDAAPLYAAEFEGEFCRLRGDHTVQLVRASACVAITFMAHDRGNQGAKNEAPAAHYELTADMIQREPADAHCLSRQITTFNIRRHGVDHTPPSSNGRGNSRTVAIMDRRAVGAGCGQVGVG
jgi:hypothetical protein